MRRAAMFPVERPAAAAAGAALLLLLLLSAHAQWDGGAAAHEMNLLSGDAFARRNSSQRQGRIFQFNNDDTAIRVELSFAIPFLSIPVGPRAPGQQGALVDVNAGALAAGGVFTVAAMLFIPHLFEGLSPQIALGRASEEGGGWGSLLSRADRLLKAQQVDAGACAQRAICSLLATSLSNSKRGAAGSVDKILDGLLSMEWLSNAMRDTVLQEAVNSARHGDNCSALYSSCPLTQRKLKNVATNLAKIIKS